MNEQKRVPLALLPQHLDYITNLLGTANLRYVDTAPIIQDIAQQIQAQQGPQEAAGTSKPNGAAHAPANQESMQ